MLDVGDVLHLVLAFFIVDVTKITDYETAEGVTDRVSRRHAYADRHIFSNLSNLVKVSKFFRLHDVCMSPSCFKRDMMGARLPRTLSPARPYATLPSRVSLPQFQQLEQDSEPEPVEMWYLTEVLDPPLRAAADGIVCRTAERLPRG